MNVVFFGTDDFAKEVLSYLLFKGINIVAVVTRPDKPKGRSGNATPPPVKEFVKSIEFHGVVYQPERASDKQFVNDIKNYNPDLFVVVSYGQIIKQNLLDVPKLGAINVHPSLLPKYRGPSPIQSAVLAGEKESGVTIMEMSLALDAGDIIKSIKTDITDEMTFGELENVLCDLSKAPLFETILEFEKNKFVEKYCQNESLATYTKKISTENSFINWNHSVCDIHNFIRGMSPSPGARCFIFSENKRKLIKILRSKIIKIDFFIESGTTLFFNKKDGWVVSCKDGAIQILDVQLEGKKKIKIIDFINGHTTPIICN